MRICAISFFTLLLFLWLVFVLALDAALAVSLHLWLYLLLVVEALLIVICLVRLVRRNLIRICFLLFLVPFVILPFVDLSPVKPFTRFYQSIHIGMSDPEVHDLLVKHFPENGPYKRPKVYYGDDGSSFILDPNDGCYNAEIIDLKMDDGKLSSKQYLPD